MSDEALLTRIDEQAEEIKRLKDELETRQAQLRETGAALLDESCLRINAQRDLKRVVAERDKAREDCGHQRATAEYLRSELSNWIKLKRADADALAIEQERVQRVRALADEWESEYGPGSKKAEVFGPQSVTIETAVRLIRVSLADSKKEAGGG